MEATQQKIRCQNQIKALLDTTTKKELYLLIRERELKRLIVTVEECQENSPTLEVALSAIVKERLSLQETFPALSTVDPTDSTQLRIERLEQTLIYKLSNSIGKLQKMNRFRAGNPILYAQIFIDLIDASCLGSPSKRLSRAERAAFVTDLALRASRPA
ncbi:MAG: hypothetical protein PW734_11475 [Verrucomicrobium sp.]|nr:hypothetical protein [Verrucomicrobium sp.]